MASRPRLSPRQELVGLATPRQRSFAFARPAVPGALCSASLPTASKLIAILRQERPGAAEFVGVGVTGETSPDRPALPGLPDEHEPGYGWLRVALGRCKYGVVNVAATACGHDVKRASHATRVEQAFALGDGPVTGGP